MQQPELLVCSASNQLSYLDLLYAYMWQVVLTCFGLNFWLGARHVQKNDILEILEWLFEAAHLTKPPLDLNKPPEVSDGMSAVSIVTEDTLA
jgi:hypothetical protein